MEIQIPRHHSQSFSQSLITGAAAKEILRSLLEASGYKVYPFGYESSLSSLKMHIWDSQITDSNAVQRVRSMPDFVVMSDKMLKLIEVKFRKRSDHEGRPGVLLKNSDLNRYRQYWDESIIGLVTPHGEHFYCQEVRDLIPGHLENKWFDYNSFSPLSEIYPETRDRMKSFHVAVEKIGTLWDEHAP